MICVGKSYHIKDAFFQKVTDSNLMANKEGTRYRPHFFFIADPDIDGIYWAIPQSTKVEKYRAIIEKKMNRYGRCNTIVIAKFGGRENVFLIQNMFPIIEKYVDHEHTINGESVRIHPTIVHKVTTNARQVLSLHKRGVQLIFTDVDRIYAQMKEEL